MGEGGEGTESDLLRRLEERRARHRERGRLYRLAVVVVGFLLVVAGIVLSGPGVPGPGFLVIALGLALLALEFTWAERLLTRVVEKAERARARAAEASPRQKLVSVLTGAVVAAAVVLVILLYDVPYLPI